jgi:hypothetical protein
MCKTNLHILNTTDSHEFPTSLLSCKQSFPRLNGTKERFYVVCGRTNGKTINCSVLNV